MRASLSRLVSTIVTGFLVVACAPAASPNPAATPAPSVPRASAPAPPPATDAPIASPSPSAPAPAPGGPLGWIHIGDADVAFRLDHLLPLDNGYFGWERTDFPEVWYAADGEEWRKSSDLAKPVTPCPGWIVRPDGEVLAAASNGDQVVLVGLEYDPNAAVCGNWRAAAWVSDDGMTWNRAPGFGPTGRGNVWTENVWATPEGWEAVMKGYDEGLQIWRSADGLQWEPGPVIAEGGAWNGVVASASESNGTKLLGVFYEATERTTLFASGDGDDWHELRGFPQTYGVISRLLAPDATAPHWTAVTVDDAADRSTIWTSADLEHWQDAPFPMPVVETLAHTTFGIVALGADPCRDVGGPCDSDPSQYFISADGTAWTPLHAAVDAETFVESGAGVIGTGRPTTEGGPMSIWRLEPYSADEAFLFDGLRDDARFACSPRRVDLPPTAVAGVECSPSDDLVDRIGVYRFTTQQELMDTYVARMEGYGVELNSGTCPEDIGEQAYVPGDGPYRYGCYLNEFGVANYRFTEPDALVYAGILGTGKGFAALHEWAWRGNEDTPGSPTVWRTPVR